MKPLAILFLAIFVLTGIGSVITTPSPTQHGQDGKPDDGVGAATAGLATSIASLFISVNAVLNQIDTAVQNAAPIARALYGLLQCCCGLLALVGLFALSSARHAFKRFLG